MPLDSEQVTALKILFEAVDSDNDGYITSHDLETIALRCTIDQNGRAAKTALVREILPSEKDETINVIRFVAFLERALDVVTSSQPETENYLGQQQFFTISLYCLLEDKRAIFVSDGKYIEAGDIQKQLDNLFQYEVSKRHQVIHSKQTRGLDAIRKAHNDQYLAYDKEWNEFEIDFEKRLSVAMASLKQQQESNMKKMAKKFEIEARSAPPVWSKELKEWRKREKILAFQEHYSEAQKVKIISDALEEEELKKASDNWSGTLERKKSNFEQQQKAEMVAFMKRIHAQRDANTNKRKLDCQRLLQRNHNIQASLRSKMATEGQRQFASIEKNVRREIDTQLKKGLTIIQKTNREKIISGTYPLPNTAVLI